MNTSNTVKHSILAALVSALALTTSCGGNAGDSTNAGDSAKAVPTREASALVSVAATVKTINQETRQVTLADELGKETSFVVDKRVERLGEISVGDTVTADYYLSLAFELREPTAEERANPLQIDQDSARAPKEVAPAGAAARVIKAVCTIEGLDRPTETVTLMGPLGGLNVVKVRDLAILPKLAIGQSVVVTYTEALVIALEKVKP
jgi:Cu/Ag efflux protein CusF